MGNMDEITLKSFAKINLSLEVTGRRPDGYHDICSLMQGIGLHDVIKITKCPRNGTKYNLPHCTIDGVDVYLCTDAKTIPADMSNLAFRGVKAVLDEYVHGSAVNVPGWIIDGTSGLVINLDKMLPVAAGIAGGSGNAAVCMLGLNALAGNPLSLRELMRIGAAVGADVPFSLLMNAYANCDILSAGGEGLAGIEEASQAAWMSGIGDIVEPVSPEGYYVVMANPGIAVSTRAAYEAIDAINGDGRTATGKLFINDLEAYTLRDYPEAARLRNVMQTELDADTVLMSGSGPTMVAYYSDLSRAETGYARMKEIADRETNWRTWFTQTGML